jgi:hypothetical protein
MKESTPSLISRYKSRLKFIDFSHDSTNVIFMQDLNAISKSNSGFNSCLEFF